MPFDACPLAIVHVAVEVLSHPGDQVDARQILADRDSGDVTLAHPRAATLGTSLMGIRLVPHDHEWADIYERAGADLAYAQAVAEVVVFHHARAHWSRPPFRR
jgi:hypothetical protein